MSEKKECTLTILDVGVKGGPSKFGVKLSKFIFVSKLCHCVSNTSLHISRVLVLLDASKFLRQSVTSIVKGKYYSA